VKVDHTLEQRGELVRGLPCTNQLLTLKGVDPQNEIAGDLVLYKILSIYQLVTAITERFHAQAIQANLRDR